MTSIRLTAIALLPLALVGCTSSSESSNSAQSAEADLTATAQDTLQEGGASNDMATHSASAKIEKSDDEWRAMLTAEQFEVTRRQGTERPFTGQYWNEQRSGTYLCVCCNNELFDSETKFKSGTGWPSFYEPIAPGHVGEVSDKSHGWNRTEVTCARCDAHLGHVFPDGPQPTGLRFCINSASLKLKPN